MTLQSLAASVVLLAAAVECITPAESHTCHIRENSATTEGLDESAMFQCSHRIAKTPSYHSASDMRDINSGPYAWIRYIESNGGVHRLEAKTYLIDRQYQLPPNTQIIGAGSDPKSGTIIKAVAAKKTRRICAKHAKHRKGFLLGDNTYVGKLHFIGVDTKRFHDNGLLCGGAPFETPGCAGTGEYSEPPVECGGDLGIGRGVSNVTVEDVTIKAFTVQIAFFAAPTKKGAKISTDITVRKVRAHGTWADGMNFHGAHRNILVENNNIQYTGDDAYAIWSIGALADNFTFRNNVAAKVRYRRKSGSVKNIWFLRKQYCFAIYGGLASTFIGNTCKDAKAPVAFGSFYKGGAMFGGAFTSESRSVVQGMKGEGGFPLVGPCCVCENTSMPKENVACGLKCVPHL